MNSLLTLLDDIATTLDDVAVMTKVAIKKTSTLMSDDLAVNAGVINGVAANREIPIITKIFLGSLINKIFAIASILFIDYLYSPLVHHLLFFGGIYLCYEGAHKVVEKIKNKKNKNEDKKTEKQRIKGAIITDLVLSFEIITMAKSSIKGDYLDVVISLCIVGLLASILIYGLVAVIIKIDDFGLFLLQKGNPKMGNAFIQLMPKLMKLLGFVGTTAMFLVGGSIVIHYFHLNYYTNQILQDLVVGSFSGLLAISLITLFSKVKKLLL